MQATEHFNKHKYVHLSDVLTKSDCAVLTKYVFDLYKNGKMEVDIQCPNSYSIYGDPVFDRLLATLVEPLSDQIGIRLAPTYTYCRLYLEGEELTPHVDREACEISATMTLGHNDESEVWPIFFAADDSDEAGQMFSIDVGEIVVYRGTELRHWRPKFKGKWQVQLFFHFVDKNGSFKDKVNDGRATLGVGRSTSGPKPMTSTITYDGVIIRTSDEVFPLYSCFDHGFNPNLMFTKQECESIVNIGKKLYPIKPTVAVDTTNKYVPEVRSVDTYNLELSTETRWIYDKIAAAVGKANAEYFKFDLAGITHGLQLLHYKAEDNGHYDQHMDCGFGDAATRKISVIIPLSDPTDFEGGKLLVNMSGNKVEASNVQGSIVMIPSFILHEVKPVTKGSRWSLVAWVHGGNRFR